jgi:hypothetical protein
MSVKIRKKFFEGMNFYVAIFGSSLMVLIFMYIFSYFVDIHALQAHFLNLFY